MYIYNVNRKLHRDDGRENELERERGAVACGWTTRTILTKNIDYASAMVKNYLLFFSYCIELLTYIHNSHCL